MKKLLAIVFILSSLFAFVACNTETPPPDEDAGVTPSVPDEEEGIIDIGKLDYKIVYDPYELGMEELAEEFSEKLSDKIDNELSILEYSDAKKEEYRIFIGEIPSNSSSSKEAKRLSQITASITSAYSIKFANNTLMLTGTSKESVGRAVTYVLSQVEDGELKLADDFNYTEFFFKDSSGEMSFSEEEFASSAYLAEIKINNKAIADFSLESYAYTAEYASVENYPVVMARAINPKADIEITKPEDNDGVAIITVTAEKGGESMSYEIDFKHAENAEISAEVVNKDGKSGVITFVFDDGDLRSADLILSKLMKKYDSVRPSFAIICNQLATAEKQGEDFKLTPNKFSYTPISNSVFSNYSYKYEYWKRAAEIDGVDVLSHSYSHTGESISQDPLFELQASQAILRELCGADSYTYVIPGAGEIQNKDEYYALLDGGTIYIGARSTGKSINLVNDYNPFRVSAYAVNRYGTKLSSGGAYTTNENSNKELCLSAGISEWQAYIDTAIDAGGWACFCIHAVIPEGLDSTAKWFIYEEQLDALFKYADGLSDKNDAWVANFTEASIYYAEWKNSEITASVNSDSSVTVEVSSGLDREIFNMPLTLKVPIPKTWTTASSLGNSLEIYENDDGTKFVYLNITPGDEAITITH